MFLCWILPLIQCLLLFMSFKMTSFSPHDNEQENREMSSIRAVHPKRYQNPDFDNKTSRKRN